MTDFADRLREYREQEDNKMSLFDLAENVGTTQQQIARYETGEQDLTVSRLREIAKALNIDPADLL